MSYNFEAIDDLAFEFAKSLVANGKISDVSEKAMQLAEQWHDEQSKRKSMYNARRAEWLKIDKQSDLDDSDFEVNGLYWVADNLNNVHLGKLVGFSNLNSRQQPYFINTLENDDTTRFYEYYLTQEESKGISKNTPPEHPDGSKQEYVTSSPITMSY